MRPRIIEIHEAVQGRNVQIAARNRARFDRDGVFVINVMSAPGSGKTEFLAKTLADAAEWGFSPYTPADPPQSTGLPGGGCAQTSVPNLSKADTAHIGHSYEAGKGNNLSLSMDDATPSSKDMLHYGKSIRTSQLSTFNSQLSTASRRLRMAVVVGDIATDNDARRLNITGVEVVQITTGGYCHLDARMVEEAVEGMELRNLDVLVIENVGNMVCPATFDLGEHARIAIMSVTEGEDKPVKYPTLFKRADAVVVNKIDIADAVGYQRDIAMENLRRIAPHAPVFEVSARTGKGMSDWYDYLRSAACGDRAALTHV